MNSTDNAELSWVKDEMWIAIRATFISFISVMNLLGNALCLVVLPRLRSIPDNNRMLLTILSASDFAAGLESALTIPVTCTNVWPYGNIVCILQPTFTRSLFTISIGALILINVDRYIAISKPLHYHLIVTKKRIIIVLATEFLLIGLIPSVTSMMSPTWKGSVVFDPRMSICGINLKLRTYKASDPLWATRIANILILVSGICIILCIYAKLFYITRTHINRVLDITNGMQGEFQRLSDTKALRMFFGCTITFIAAWLPITAYLLYIEFSGKQAHVAVYFFCYWIAFAGSGFDVIFLFATSSHFRQHARKLVFGRCHTINPVDINEADIPSILT